MISEFSDSVEDEIDDFFTNGVVTSGVVVGSILLATDHLFRVEQLSVCSSSDLIDHRWLKIQEDSSWDVLSGSSFREKGGKAIIGDG